MKKSKTLRSVLAVSLVLVLLFALVACGKSNPPSSTPPATASTGGESPAANKKYTLAFNTWGSGAEVFDWEAAEMKYVIETVFGMTAQGASDEFSPDGTLKNFQNFTSSGVDGILGLCNQTGVFPQCADVCVQSNTPFCMLVMVPTPEQRADQADNNPLYVASIDSDTTAEAYEIGKDAIKAGCKTAVLLMGNLGEWVSESRIAGFTQAFVTEGGGTILDTVRLAGPFDAPTGANNLLSANKDVDCIYGASGDYTAGMLSAADMLGLTNIRIYASHCAGESAEAIKNGQLTLGTGGDEINNDLAACLLVNYLDGHQILDENGKAPYMCVMPIILTSDNIDTFMSIYHSTATTGRHPLSPDTIKSLLWRYNPDVSYQDFINWCNPTIEKLSAQTW